jgi:hypothetical protein
LKPPRGLKRRKLNTVIRSRKSLHLFQLRPRLPGIPARLKLRLALTGRFASASSRETNGPSGLLQLKSREPRPSLSQTMPIRSRPHALVAPIRRSGLPCSTATQRRRPPFPVESSSQINLHRGNGIPRPRDIPPKIAFRPELVSAETETQPLEPANCGLLGRLREICRFERLRGGPERTRTACQARSRIEPSLRHSKLLGS